MQEVWSGDEQSADLGPMRLALKLAERAYQLGEVPVGAVLIREGQVVAQAHNLRELTHDPTAHAECLTLCLAGKTLKTWRLEGCTLYVTLEPCPMCAGAIVASRVDRLVYAASDPKAGACRSLYRLVDDPRLPHRVSVTSGVLRFEPFLLMKFFQSRR